ncbi:hypothetical protein JYK14_20970 [Siccirubricoccus sp. KC 17139]|uniref:Uncharacterized protein n=1 Tax=Siccirubricoccus soli TaxID=2899147 RepID=A0ABT1D9K5_9PROT|nr:hypothetical protein [Siccirubricoccus soli]MCO6418611.1 hypothetical protein [Siccirubricoccus soli]MCP2684746.1 hypothetical protein [Siccirubricoccus soli]
MAGETQQACFLALLEEMGGSAGNGALREALGWQETTYDRVKEALVEAGRIGRGRGGSVHLVAPDGGPAAVKPAAVVAPRAAAMAQAAAPARRVEAAATPRPVPSYRHAEDSRKNIRPPSWRR